MKRKTLEVVKVVDDQIRYLDRNGILKVEPNSPYFQLKILHAKGRRIKYTFEKGIRVQETFNEMVFNAEYRGEITQIRPNYADMLCQAIMDHKETGDLSGFDHVFSANYSKVYNKKIIEGVLRQYGERVKVIDDGFVIDDLFIVDRNGSAWVYKDNQKQKIGRGAGNSLCLVVNTLPPNQYTDDNSMIDKNTMTVLAKIWFLLNPNLKDNVFMDQLPEEHKEILKRNDEGFILDTRGREVL